MIRNSTVTLYKFIYGILITGLVYLGGCSGNNKYANDLKMMNSKFGNFKTLFIEELWKLYPVWATTVGYHKSDSLLNIPDDDFRKSELDFAKRTEDTLKTFKFNMLDASNKTDYRIIINFIDGVRFNSRELKPYQWDPSYYNLGDALFYIMDNHKVALEQRLRTISCRLAKIPAYFQAAKRNIRKPTREHTQLAIDQGDGMLSFFTSAFPDSLKKSKLNEAEVREFNRNANKAQKAIEGYLSWLRNMMANTDSTGFRSFRIGKELYNKKFLIDIDSRYSAAEIYQKAMERKGFLHVEMGELADRLWKKYLPTVVPQADTLKKIKMLIDTISTHHCKRNEFLQTIERQLPELVKFITTHHLIDLDSTKPLKVRVTPAYQAGVAGAGINAPGPYDSGAVTYYNVTPLDKYDSANAESYLREYNDYVLQILNIHEAIPGHYTQLIYANRSPSMIKSIFGNNAMIEGWACYGERMMIEQGYNDCPEMKLFYDKWNLREVCNYLLDYNIQCNNWTKEQGMDLLLREGFQTTAQAEEKWKRATLTQVQLACYFTGLTEIYELREETKQKSGAKFNLKKFHEDFLSYGSAPVKEIRQLMLQN